MTEFRAPRLSAPFVTVATDGTVWIGGVAFARGDDTGVVARRDATGRFERIFRAPPWIVEDMRAAPDGRLWLVSADDDDVDSVGWAAWLPPNPCLSRRRISLHLHSRRGDPIRSVRLSVQGGLTRTFHGREPRIPIDLRGYLPGAIGVTLRVRTAHRRSTRHRVYHTCTSSG